MNTQVIQTFKNPPPLSLYIHIPWCIRKCPYCDFNSHKSPQNLPQESYIKALEADLEKALPLIWGRSIRSVFIGGGTPSLFDGDKINQILTIVRKLTHLSPIAEITLEANPGTVDSSHIKDYAKSGVNRISIGVQSFNNSHLKSLGRVHDSDKAATAINIAKQHIDNINIDLMYGLPNQNLDELYEDIEMALSFKPNHISYYNLTIEPNTIFASQTPDNLPDNDLCYQMQDIIQKKLTQNHYYQYEVSAYARNSFQCSHNLNYWLFGDYLGIGAGAHSKLTMQNKIIRQVRQKHPQTYMDNTINNKHIIEEKTISHSETPFEFALNSFRLTDGFLISSFGETTGLPLSIIMPKLLKASDLGFLELSHNRVTTTLKGKNFLNDLLMLFLED